MGRGGMKGDVNRESKRRGKEVKEKERYRIK